MTTEARRGAQVGQAARHHGTAGVGPSLGAKGMTRHSDLWPIPGLGIR
jgi:hypothetical protein